MACLAGGCGRLALLPCSAKPPGLTAVPPRPCARRSFPAMHPGTADLLSSQSQTPEQQCMVISHWLNLAGGILFPVAVLWHTERRARRRFRRLMRQQYGQQQHPATGGALSGTQARWWECSILSDRGCRWLESPVLLFFMSNLIWIGAHAL